MNGVNPLPPPGGGPGGASPRPSDDPGMPKELWFIGLGFSLFLITAGLAVMAWFEHLYAFGGLAVCIGFGIALTTFGTRVGGQFLTFNMVGGGATAVALYLLLYNFPLSSPDSPRYVIGQIRNSAGLKDIRISAKEAFLTGRTAVGGDFRFLAIINEIGDGSVRFNFDFPPNSEQKEFFINCVSTSYLKEAIKKRDTISLSLDLELEGEGRHRLLEKPSDREIGQLNVRNCDAPARTPSVKKDVTFLDWFSIAAFAQQRPPVDIPKTIGLLESEDGDQRDRARDQLASLRGADAYKAMAESWTIETSSYRADLGRLVAWSAAIDQNRETAVALAAALTPAQLRYLVQLTGQGDITLRQFATEVLHRLLETTGWPNGPSAEDRREIIEATLAAFASPTLEPLSKPSMRFSRDNMLFNTLVAIGFTDCNIGLDVRPTVVAALSKFAVQLASAGNAPKTADKLGKVLAKLRACGPAP